MGRCFLCVALLAALSVWLAQSRAPETFSILMAGKPPARSCKPAVPTEPSRFSIGSMIADGGRKFGAAIDWIPAALSNRSGLQRCAHLWR